MDKENALVVFQDKKIRGVWFNDEWFFSVVAVLTDGEGARKVLEQA